MKTLQGCKAKILSYGRRKLPVLEILSLEWDSNATQLHKGQDFSWLTGFSSLFQKPLQIQPTTAGLGVSCSYDNSTTAD